MKFSLGWSRMILCCLCANHSNRKKWEKILPVERRRDRESERQHSLDTDCIIEIKFCKFLKITFCEVRFYVFLMTSFTQKHAHPLYSVWFTRYFPVLFGLKPARLPRTRRTLKIDLHENEHINSFKLSNVDVQHPFLYRKWTYNFPVLSIFRRTIVPVQSSQETRRNKKR